MAHDCPHACKIPKTNVDYWTKKIAGNIKRDSRVQTELKELGWQPVVIWECQINNDLTRRLNRS